jgi:exopolysaccharide biosynthesis WecB/TagA/CpsF family protein
VTVSTGDRRTASLDGLTVTAFASVGDAACWLAGPDGRPLPGVAVALNPEKVMRARRDPELRGALQRATVLFPDGGGVAFVVRWGGTPTARVPGCELWERLLVEARSARVFLLGGRPGVVERVRGRLAAVHPGVNVVGLHHGYFQLGEERQVFDRINASHADLVSVGLGSPKQEVFMAHAADACPGDVFLGDVRRAPKAFWATGFEWAYRLALDPRRWRRQTALVAFLTLFLTRRLNGNGVQRDS